MNSIEDKDTPHICDRDQWDYCYRFNTSNARAERSTWYVIWLTVITMVVEIAAGFAYGSMALLADGWHMSTHAAALGITAFTYHYARRHANNPKYSFGTGKISVLGGFTSAIVLAVVALLVAAESIERFLFPHDIQFNQAIFVAVLGLIVNLVSAFLLKEDHHHGHSHHHSHDHHHHHHDHDHNLKSAYFHVLADALTSLLAIIALSTGKVFGWLWMDSMMGIVGAIIILRWSYGLLRDTSKILLDSELNQESAADIRTLIESDKDSKVLDLHIWQLGANKAAAIISVTTHLPKSPDDYKKLLSKFKELKHITVEVNHCLGDHKT